MNACDVARFIWSVQCFLALCICCGSINEKPYFANMKYKLWYVKNIEKLISQSAYFETKDCETNHFVKTENDHKTTLTLQFFNFLYISKNVLKHKFNYETLQTTLIAFYLIKSCYFKPHWIVMVVISYKNKFKKNSL